MSSCVSERPRYSTSDTSSEQKSTSDCEASDLARLPTLLLCLGDAVLGERAPAAEGDRAAPAAEGDRAAPAAEGDRAAPAAEGDRETESSLEGERAAENSLKEGTLAPETLLEGENDRETSLGGESAPEVSLGDDCSPAPGGESAFPGGLYHRLAPSVGLITPLGLHSGIPALLSSILYSGGKYSGRTDFFGF